MKIIFPFGVNSTAIPQAQRNASWLADQLSKATAEPVFVQPIVALPGWFVVDPKPEQVPVMGPNYLKGYLRRQLNSVISPAQVERIVAFLEILIGRWIFDYRAVPRITSDDSRPVRSRLRIGPIE